MSLIRICLGKIKNHTKKTQVNIIKISFPFICYRKYSINLRAFSTSLTKNALSLSSTLNFVIISFSMFFWIHLYIHCIAVIRQFFHKFDRHALTSFFNSKFRNYIFFNVFVNSFVCNAVIRQFNLLIFMKKEFKIVISLHLDILFLL